MELQEFDGETGKAVKGLLAETASLESALAHECRFRTWIFLPQGKQLTVDGLDRLQPLPRVKRLPQTSAVSLLGQCLISGVKNFRSHLTDISV